MLAADAAKTINALRYKTGWTFEALALDGFDHVDLEPTRRLLGRDNLHSVVLLHYTVETVDTNRENARIGYLLPKTLDNTVPLDASDFRDADELLFYLFQWVMELEEHESREFFRCADRDWHAPFHPHRAEGAELWATCVARAQMTN